MRIAGTMQPMDRLLLLVAVFALGCTDATDEGKPTPLDGSAIDASLTDAGRRARLDASLDADVDADQRACFGDDVPAPGCPCSRSPRVYCCGPNFGIACTPEGVWGPFLGGDDVCPIDEDGGVPHDLECA